MVLGRAAVLGPTSDAGTAPPASGSESAADLFGRSAELAELHAALDGARAGRAGAVLLAGDAGIGKSRLAAELAAHAAAAGTTVVVGRCLDTGPAPLPYLPFSEVLAGLPIGPAELVADRPALGGLVPGDAPAPDAARGDRDLDRAAVFDAVAGALRAAAQDAPLLVVLEDLHWADGSSRELLSYLLARLGSQPLLVLATYRADDLHRRHPLRRTLAELVRLPPVRRMELGPLRSGAVLELVRARAAASATGLGDDVLHRIADRSGGNAFYAEEMVSAGRAELPDALADVLLTRLDQLSEAARAVLQVASLAERRIPHDLLQEAAGLPADELAAGLREAVSHHVLVPVRPGDEGADAYAFRHALLREAVYDDLLPGERVRLHGRLAELLAGRDRPGTAAELARHAVAAHDLPRALAASVRAAREAERRHGPAEALVHAERALELWAAVPDPEGVAGLPESVLTGDAAWAASGSGDPDRGIALGLRAVRVADEREGHRARADTRVRYALRLLDHGSGPVRSAEATEAAAAAVELLADEAPGPERAWAHAALARVLLTADHAEPAWEHARAALDAVRAADPADWTAAERRDLTAAHADALATLAFCTQREGDPARARDLLADAAALAEASGNRAVELRTVWSRGVSFLEDSLLDAAATEFDDGWRRAVRYGLSWAGYGLEFALVRVRVAFQRGDWDTAADLAGVADPAVPVRVAGVLPAAGALVTMARGDLDGAEELIAALAEQPGPRSFDQLALLLGIVGTEAARWRGDPGLAARRARSTVDELRRDDPGHLVLIMVSALGAAAYPDLAAAARASGAPDAEARTAAAEMVASAESATERGLPRGSGLGAEGRAWLARVHAEAGRARGMPDPDAWTPVVETFAGYGDDYRAAEARYRRAAAYLERAARGGAAGTRAAAGDRRAAAEDLAAAAATAARLGARPLATAVAELSARAGEPTGVPPTGTGATGAAAATGGSAAAGGAAAAGGSGDAAGAAAELRPTPLTPREQAVLQQVAYGLTNRAIGERLYISEKTVSVHLSRAMTKLGASGRAEAVSVAHARGLLPPHR
ncbi:helix-turn-helix transcriptional regulator [Pseudonocardia nantongensis]|uniref:helix-turn-helix transcriptional regulator n=1 Tax=Pseudonocardia nantongensis TaxID=1181885 RepID=UPI00397AEA3C